MKKLEHPSIVDLAAPPRIPREGWTVEEHLGSGPYFCDPWGVELYLSPRQLPALPGGMPEGITGTLLRQELRGKQVLNANVRDFFYEHPDIIPATWKLLGIRGTRRVFFFGTVFLHHDSSRTPMVPFIEWLPSHQWHDGERAEGWHRGEFPIGQVLDQSNPAAVMMVRQPLPQARLLR